MKILFVVHGFPPHQVAGTEVLARNVARCLAKNRNEVVVFAPAFSHEQEGESVLEEVKVHRFSVPLGRESRFSDTYLEDTVDFQFAKFVSEVKPDVAMVWHTINLSAGILEILSQMAIPYALFLADFHYPCHLTHLLTSDMKPCDGPEDGTKCGKCILATVPSHLLEKEGADAAELGRRRVSQMRELLGRPSVMIAPSEFVKEKYMEFGIHGQRILVISPGVDVRTIRQSYKPVRSDKLRFGYFGGDSEQRGIALVLNAFKAIQDGTVELTIAGQGTQRYLSTSPLPTNVRFLGRYLPDNVGKVLSGIDVLVVPSRCHESYNLVSREAFAARIPVIVSDLRAQSDAVREGIDSLHFKAGDAADLASRMRLLKTKRKTLEKLRHGIRNVPDVRRQATKFDRLLKGLVRHSRTHAASFETMLDRIERMQVEIVRLRSALREKEREPLILAETLGPSSAIAKLIELYRSREDLKKAFPEAATGSMDNLISWAAKTATGGHPDGDSRILQPYSGWYVWVASEKNIAILNERVRLLEDETARLGKELSLKTGEAATRTIELHAVQAHLAILASEKSQLGTRLGDTQAELDDMRRSFGYKFMRSYGSVIDHLLPDGTRRGDFRKAVTKSLRALVGERIVEPTPAPVVELTTIRQQEDRKPVSPETWVRVHCDYPELSDTAVAKVSDSFMLTGWAVSEKGIREVRVYLDGAMFGSAVYHIARPDVGAAFPGVPGSQVSGFRKMISTQSEERKTPHRLKIIAESDDGSSSAVEGTIEFSESIPVHTLLGPETTDQPERVTAKSSVVILTRSPPDDFGQTLDKIRQQELTSRPEIIIVNSGTKDLSDLAETYGARVLSIDPAEFDHASTRNYGAEQTTGDYIFFMTDDSIPANKQLFGDMIRVLRSDEKVAAATARQIPRTDADLMACQAIWGHYRMLGLESDRVVGSTQLDAATPREKRRVCQIDDVCSCFKRDVFLKYKYKTDIAYAEDLELGVRLLRDGYKIAQLFSVGVAHSHNRASSYYLKRTYVDVKTLSELLEDRLTDMGGSEEDGQSLVDLLDDVLDLYNSLCYGVDELKEHGFHGGDISMAFRAIQKRFTDGYEETAPPKTQSADMPNILARIMDFAEYHPRKKPRSKPIGRGYLSSLTSFQGWLLSSHETLGGIEDEFVETLFKLLGTEIGRLLGRYYVRCLSSKQEEAGFAQLDKFLSEGV